MIISRQCEKTLLELAKGYPVIAVTGPRQSGKSTLVQRVFPEKEYVSLEDLEVREFAEEDPKGFLSQFPQGAILDEIQRTPDLFSYIQVYIDREGKPGQFILTGSQQFNLFGGITQSLAGRVAAIVLMPFSVPELKPVNWLPESLDELLLKGFYPPIYDRNLNYSIWYSNYMRTYLERDVRQLLQIRNLSVFQRFLRMCAARTGQLLNLSSLANDCGITHNTARAWISVLEASYILYLLKPHHENFNKRLIKTPKLYFLDTGLAAWLLGIKLPSQLGISPFRGQLFETFVVSEFLKLNFNIANEPNLYFWRDRTGNEIDIVIDEGSKLIPIEIKSGQTIVSDFFSSLKKWHKIALDRSERGYLIYAGDSVQKRELATVVSWKKMDRLIN